MVPGVVCRTVYRWNPLCTALYKWVYAGIFVTTGHVKSRWTCWLVCLSDHCGNTAGRTGFGVWWYYLTMSLLSLPKCYVFNMWRPRQNGVIFRNGNVWISIWISLEFVTKSPINKVQALIQRMAWCRPSDKPLSEPLMVRLPTRICVTRPQWVILLDTLLQSMVAGNVNVSWVTKDPLLIPWPIIKKWFYAQCIWVMERL